MTRKKIMRIKNPDEGRRLGKTLRNPFVEEMVGKGGLHETSHRKDRKRGGGRNRTQELLTELDEDQEYFDEEDLYDE